MSKSFITYRFHSKWLIPERVAEDALKETTEAGKSEVIMLWQEAHQSSHHFKPGETCYHMDDLDTPMRVDKILRDYPKPVNGEKTKSKIIGIQVHWHQQVQEEKYL